MFRLPTSRKPTKYQNRVLPDRTAQRGAEVEQQLDLVTRGDTGCSQLIGQVVSLGPSFGPREEGLTAHHVAAVLGYEVHAHAASRHLGAKRRPSAPSLPERSLVVVRLHVAPRVHADAVHFDRGVGADRPVHGEPLLRAAARAATFDSLTFTPGTSAPSAAYVRPVGTASSTLRGMTADFCVLWTSTSGEPPDTVIVSSSDPTPVPHSPSR